MPLRSMTFNRLLPFSIILPIAACSGSNGLPDGLADNPVVSGFATVSSSNEIDVDLEQKSSRSISNSQVGRVVYVAGAIRDAGQMITHAGIAPGATVGSAQTSGTATYSASYRYHVIDDIRRTQDAVFITTHGVGPIHETGSITLTADFDTGRLTGSGTEFDVVDRTTSSLDVNGTISGSDLGGTVTATYGEDLTTGSVDGTLTGNIGTTGVIGAFTGQDSNTSMSGGFVGTRD
jgi:hypothetical protein